MEVAARGQAVDLIRYHVDGAFDALAGGDAARHDALVAKRARENQGSDVVVLAQFTRSRAAPTVAAVAGIPVLNSPGAAVFKMRRMLGALSGQAGQRTCPFRGRMPDVALDQLN